MIRPDRGGSSSDRSLEFSLEDIEQLGRHLIRDAREKVQAAEKEKLRVEGEVRGLRDAFEKERVAKMEELAAELGGLRESIPVEAEKARTDGFAKGRAEGFEEGKTEGCQSGFEEGYEKGRQQGYVSARDEELGRIKEQTEAVVATLGSVNDDLQRKRRDLVTAAKSELVGLACRIAEKILQREVSLDPEVVNRNVEKAVDMVFQSSKVLIEVHPDDADLVAKYSHESRDLVSEFRDFEISTVRSMQRGGCRVTSGTSQVDLSIETQLAVIEERLRAFGGVDSDEESSGDSQENLVVEVES